MNMKENEKKAFDFAAETTKQLITLSTVIIALTITFSKDIIGGADNEARVCIFWAWGLFIASVFFGILTLMALTGTLQQRKKNKTEEESENNLKEKEISIYRFNIRLPSILQIFLFLAALILTAIFGCKSITASDSKANKNKNEECITIIKETKYWIDNSTRNDTIKFID